MITCWSDEQWLTARRMAREGADAVEIGQALGRRADAVVDKFNKHGMAAPRMPRPRGITETTAKNTNGAGQVIDRVPAQALVERETRLAAAERRTLTQTFFNDPPPGYSALDRRS